MLLGTSIIPAIPASNRNSISAGNVDATILVVWSLPPWRPTGFRPTAGGCPTCRLFIHLARFPFSPAAATAAVEQRRDGHAAAPPRPACRLVVVGVQHGPRRWIH